MKKALKDNNIYICIYLAHPALLLRIRQKRNGRVEAARALTYGFIEVYMGLMGLMGLICMNIWV
jgi:hypothetical protein